MSIKDNLDDTESKQGFVSRWSRKKTAEVAEKGASEVSDSPDIASIPLNTVLPSVTTGRMSTSVQADRVKAESKENDPGEAMLTDEDMPEVETLGEGSDFTGFMSPGVSDKLRKLALRKLFAGAGFNIRDGLDDYDEDFTNFEPLGDIITCDMKHQAEVKEEKRLRALAEAEAEAAEKQAVENASAESENQEIVDKNQEQNDDELLESADKKELAQEPVLKDDQTETSPEATVAAEDADHNSTPQT